MIYVYVYIYIYIERERERSRCEALLGAVEGTPERPAHAILYSSGLAGYITV